MLVLVIFISSISVILVQAETVYSVVSLEKGMKTVLPVLRYNIYLVIGMIQVLTENKLRKGDTAE